MNHIIDVDGSIYNSGSRSMVKVVRNGTTVATRDSMGSKLKLYPNPTSGFLTVAGINLQRYDAAIFAEDGRGIVDWQRLPGPSTIDISKLPNDLNYLVLSKEGEIIVEKIVKSF